MSTAMPDLDSIEELLNSIAISCEEEHCENVAKWIIKFLCVNCGSVSILLCDLCRDQAHRTIAQARKDPLARLGHAACKGGRLTYIETVPLSSAA